MKKLYEYQSQLNINFFFFLPLYLAQNCSFVDNLCRQFVDNIEILRAGSYATIRSM